ncbi:MAG: VWA domain-containing protein [Treponemataceae bacterium]|nr:VWA domain-containing protein [Treponemataceae bacterium]
MLEFQNPAAFLLLLAVPGFAALRRLGIFSRAAFPLTLSDWNGGSFSWNGAVRRFASRLASALFAAGFAAGVGALAEPAVYHQERVYTSRGTDVMFVLDVSPSMAAADIAGGRRLDAAKRSLRSLVESNPGASFGIVAMAGDAAVVVPPTVDCDVFLERLDGIAIGSLGDGTALGTGLSTAVYHLISSSAPKKCVVLATDGENNAGAIHPDTAAALAAKRNITVYTLGIGTSGSVPIEYEDPETGTVYSGFLNSSFDSSSLRRIAQLGGGRYFEIQTLADLSLALTVISRAEHTAQTYRTKTTEIDFYDRFVLAAGILFALSWLVKRLYLQECI